MTSLHLEDPTQADMADIAALTQRMIVAWAANDAGRIADLFLPEGTMILTGIYRQGRPAIHEYFTDMFHGDYEGTNVTGEPVSCRLLSPDVAVLLTQGGVLAPHETEPSPAEAIRASWTLVRREHHWWIAAYQNTPR